MTRGKSSQYCNPRVILFSGFIIVEVEVDDVYCKRDVGQMADVVDYGYGTSMIGL